MGDLKDTVIAWILHTLVLVWVFFVASTTILDTGRLKTYMNDKKVHKLSQLLM